MGYPHAAAKLPCRLVSLNLLLLEPMVGRLRCLSVGISSSPREEKLSLLRRELVDDRRRCRKYGTLKRDVGEEEEEESLEGFDVSENNDDAVTLLLSVIIIIISRLRRRCTSTAAVLVTTSF